MKPLLGVFGVVGTWADWQRFFDLSRVGLVRSCLALTICFPSLWLVMVGLETERARLAETHVPDFSVLPFVTIISLWLLSFPVTAGLVALLMNQTNRLQSWLIVRNWAVAWICLVLGLIFAFVIYIGLPTIMGRGALFAAYMGLLPIDIRIARRAGEFRLMMSILIGCTIVSTGMMVMLAGLLQLL